MKNDIARRNILKATTALAALGTTAFAKVPPPPKKHKWLRALKIGMLPGKISDKEKFELAKRAGFDGIDGSPIADLSKAKAQADLAREIGVPIHGLVYGGWHTPLSDPNPAVIKKGLDGMEQALKHANHIGADTVLLVPGIVKENVPYDEAHKRSQENVRKLIPIAEELNVTIGIENVWNKMLLSPMEYAKYIDDFESKHVKAYFDIGNIIIQGFAQHWIRILGKDRICKLDVKDFKRKGFQFTPNIYEGNVNWKEVYNALNEIGYEGWMTAEVRGGNEEHLTEIARRMTLFNNGIFKK